MFRFVMPAIVAGIIGVAAMGAAPAPAAGVSPQALFADLKQSGAAVEFTQFPGRRGALPERFRPWT